jgi:hypothetical protein
MAGFLPFEEKAADDGDAPISAGPGHCGVFASGRCARDPLSAVLGQSLPIRPLAANVGNAS